MFKPVSLVFQSCEGTVWNSLIDLEDYLLSIIPKNLLDKMLEEHYILDGEVYLPGHTVNEINHFVKDPKCKENKLLQYWCYDIAIEDYSQEERCVIRYNYLHKYSKRFNNKEEQALLFNEHKACFIFSVATFFTKRLFFCFYRFVYYFNLL